MASLETIVEIVNDNVGCLRRCLRRLMAIKFTKNLLSVLNVRFLCFVGSKDYMFCTNHRSSATNSKIGKKTFSTTSTKSINTTPIDICIAQEHDRDRLLDFIRIHFYPEEPINIGKGPKTPVPEEEEFFMSNLKYGTSLMALRTNDCEEVMGAAIAGPKDCHELQNLLEIAANYSPKSKWGSILQLLIKIERETNVYERFQIERVLHVHALGVHKDARGLALGARLMKDVMKLGKSLNYELLTADCSSVYSAQLCERIGMECINAIWYNEYLDEDGNQIFQPPPPHDSVKTFAKYLC